MIERDKYVWKKGYQGYLQDSTMDAQKTGEEIKAIVESMESKGELMKPEDMVNYARNNTDSELHKGFEWDDSIAGEKYRIEQARYINRILVYVENTPQEEKFDNVEIRVFQQPERNKGYRETIQIVKNEDEYQSLLKQAYDELRRFKKKYSTLSELSEIFALIP